MICGPSTTPPSQPRPVALRIFRGTPVSDRPDCESGWTQSTVVTPSGFRSSFHTRNGQPSLLRTTLGAIDPAGWHTRGPSWSYGPIGVDDDGTATTKCP